MKPTIIQKHVCDVCHKYRLCIYIPELDKWYCRECVQIMEKILEICA
ncbi:MAG: hypothetical protein QXL57_08480 [Candidatus Bathyarchaeia archaeon]